MVPGKILGMPIPPWLIPVLQLGWPWIRPRLEVMFAKLKEIITVPVIELKLLSLVRFEEPLGETFQVEVRSSTGRKVLARVFLDQITDSQGQSTGEVASKMEIYRSDTLEPMWLFGEEKGLAAVVSIERTNPSDPKLRINTKIVVEGKTSLGRVILKTQSETRLRFLVVFYGLDGTTELIDDVFPVSFKKTDSGYEAKAIPRKLRRGFRRFSGD